MANLSSPSLRLVSDIEVSRSPFGQKDPPIPTARSITLARIASPTSEQKRYQPLVIHALRRYFKDGARILKKGDLLALPVSLGSAALLEGLIDEDSKRTHSSDDLLNRYVFRPTVALELTSTPKTSELEYPTG